MSERQLIDFKAESVNKRIEKPPPNPRIAGIDPGRMQSGFGLVGIEVQNPVIYIIGAKQWKHQLYNQVEDEVEEIHRTVVKRPFTHLVVEKNNTGIHVIENMLINNHLPVMPISTVGKVTDIKKQRIGNSMVKNDMVHWVRRKILNGLLLFPEEDSEGTRQLRNQLPKFTRSITKAGNITYGAQGKGNDDLVMALILACYVARRKYLKGSRIPYIGSANYKTGKKRYRRLTQKDYFPELEQEPYAKIQGFSVRGPG